MGWILLFAIFILLFIIIKCSPIEEEKWQWTKTIGFYLTGIISLNIQIVKIPLGILIGLYFINRKPTLNRRLKNLALFFGFVYFLLVAILPPIPVRDLLFYREIFTQINRFESIHLITRYSYKSQEQNEISKLAPNASGNMNLDDCIVMFRSWILKKENVSVNNFEWLWMQSDDQLKFKDSYHRIDDLTAEGYMTFEDGRKYFALFKKKHKYERYYLAMVVEYERLKTGQERRFPF